MTDPRKITEKKLGDAIFDFMTPICGENPVVVDGKIVRGLAKFLHDRYSISLKGK